MSLHKNSTDRPPVESPQAGESVTTDRKQTSRLYPSLPRYDFVCVEEKLQTAAARHPDSLQSEASVGGGGGSGGVDDVRMRAQILILEEQRQELLSINEKWAKEYRTMTQYYKEKMQDLKALLRHDHSHFEEEMFEEGERNIPLHRRAKEKESTWAKDVDVSSELLKAEKEARELRAQNSTLTRRGQHQREEIRRLNEALEEALQKTEPLDVSSETLQEIWKHQAEVYKEDFQKERKDREKLKDKYLELEKKFRKVHGELHVLKHQVTRSRPAQSALECTCTNRPKSPDWEVRQVNQHHMQIQRRYTLDDKL